MGEVSEGGPSSRIMYDALDSSNVERVAEDVLCVAARVEGMRSSFSGNLVSGLVLEYIISSEKIRKKAIAIKALYPRKVGDSSGGKWEYYFEAFKQYQRELAEEEHRHNPELDCDGAWYKAQQRLAEEIILGRYDKVEDSGKGL